MTDNMKADLRACQQEAVERRRTQTDFDIAPGSVLYLNKDNGAFMAPTGQPPLTAPAPPPPHLHTPLTPRLLPSLLQHHATCRSTVATL